MWFFDLNIKSCMRRKADRGCRRLKKKESKTKKTEFSRLLTWTVSLPQNSCEQVKFQTWARNFLDASCFVTTTSSVIADIVNGCGNFLLSLFSALLDSPCKDGIRPLRPKEEMTPPVAFHFPSERTCFHKMREGFGAGQWSQPEQTQSASGS